MGRISKNEWFLKLAETIAERSTCCRKKVGCIIVKDGLIVSTGFNGVARGESECPENGCSTESSEGCHTIHAEINAIINAARLGVSINGAEIFITLKPCSDCTRALINAGISKVFYKGSGDKYETGHNIKIENYIETIKM
ncbi:MAG TPA: dCMP deaminase family protein [Candidatus Absconditabacterales bacterium]|nr:dCMP deaminase family protein [Candidatus Absconditabacterales bacterium]